MFVEKEFIEQKMNVTIELVAYATISDCDKYYSQMPNSRWFALSEEKKQWALIKATEYIDSQFDWAGAKEQDEQNLQFPRIGVYYPSGKAVEGIPSCVKQATILLAIEVFNADEEEVSLLPNISKDDMVVKEDTQLGDLKTSVTYGSPFTQVKIDKFPNISKRIEKYLLSRTDRSNVPITASYKNNVFTPDIMVINFKDNK